MKKEKDKKELKILEKWKYKFVDQTPTERTVIEEVIIFVHDTRVKHESGYPLIRIFGNIGNNKLISLGWHDHFLIYQTVNIDALGKNVFRVMHWGLSEKFWFRGSTIWRSSFEIRKDGELR